MSTVFISHAGADKALVEPLVRALVAWKVQLFVDNPNDRRWTFTADEIAEWEKEGLWDSIRLGRPYDDELERGLDRSDMIFLCLSRGVVDSKSIIVSEVRHWAKAGRVLPILIDDLRDDEIDEHLGLFRARAAQRITLDPALTLRAIVKTLAEQTLIPPEEEELRQFKFVLKFMEDVRDGVVGEEVRRNGWTARDRKTPDLAELEGETFKAGRWDQRDAISERFLATQAGGVQAVVVSGPDNEKVPEFVEKLRRCGRACFHARGPVQALEATLPSQSASKDWRAFKSSYAANLAKAIKMPESAAVSLPEIASFAAGLGAPLLIYSPTLTLKRMMERKRAVAHWLQFWREFGEAPAKPSITTILSVVLPNEERDRRQGARLRAFQSWMRGLEKRGVLWWFNTPAAPMSCLDPITPVTWDEAHHWARGECPELDKRGRVDAALERVYGSPEIKESGIPMMKFHEQVPGAIREELDGIS